MARNSLTPWLGSVPNGFFIDDRHPGYRIGRVAADKSPSGTKPMPLGDWWCALWGPRGDVVVGVRGTVLMEFIPKLREIALIRQEAPGKPKGRCDTWFERWTLDGVRTSQLLVDPKLAVGMLTAMVFATSDKGRVVEIETEDASFFVAIGGRAPDRAAATREELASKT